MENYRVIEIKQSVFADNDQDANRLRQELKENKTFLLNRSSDLRVFYDFKLQRGAFQPGPRYGTPVHSFHHLRDNGKRFAHLKNHLINFLKVLFFGDPVNLLDDVYDQTQLVHVQASRTMRLRTCLMRASL